MPILVQTADEDEADEAALAARITALETLLSDYADVKARANRAETALDAVTALLVTHYPQGA